MSCSPNSAYDCEKCCPGLKRVSADGYTWCEKGKPSGGKCSEANPEGCFFLPYNKTYLSPERRGKKMTERGGSKTISSEKDGSTGEYQLKDVGTINRLKATYRSLERMVDRF